MMATIMVVASQTWDNLLMSALYGPAVAGAYALAYNLADIPATQVGEQISDVLTPSLVHLSPNDRRKVLIQSTAMLSLIVFPLAVGLGAVAKTLVSTLLRNAWSMVAPMLSILAFLSVVRPIGWTIGSYLSVQGRTKTIMWLSLLNVVVLFSSMGMLGHWFGPLAACYGVGIGFSTHALGSVWVVRRSEGIPLSSFLRATMPPLAASAVLAAAVFASRWWLTPHLPHLRGIALSVELIAGGIAYIAAIAAISPTMLAQLLRLVRVARRTSS
jgi:PST family polysaccharide transporter